MKLLFRSNLGSMRAGFSAILLLFIILFLIIGGLIAYDFGYIAYMEQQNVYPTPTPVPGKINTPITAQGIFTKDKYNVDISLNFPLEGGMVSGKFSGDCSGSISGNYDGGDGGKITGKALGSCDPLLVPIPASAVFSGSVNQQQKTVSITGTGSALGVSGNGSLMLTF